MKRLTIKQQLLISEIKSRGQEGVIATWLTPADRNRAERLAARGVLQRFNADLKGHPVAYRLPDFF